MEPQIAIIHLVWDDWNRQHLKKHDVLPGEAEQVAANRPVVRETYKGRFQLIGPTNAGQMLVVIVGPVPHQAGTYYVFSARPAHRKERRFYEDRRGEQST